MFACMMALFNVGTAIGEGVATSLTDNIGFANVFIMLAAVNLIGLPILFALFRTAPDIAKRTKTTHAEPTMVSADQEIIT
jgi:predicted MFS family arabinose efflux permease